MFSRHYSDCSNETTNCILRGSDIIWLQSHGILGQSFNRQIKVLHDRLDKYPHKGTFKTSAQAEGSIQGDYKMYAISSPLIITSNFLNSMILRQIYPMKY